MAAENVKRFYQEVEKSEELQKKIIEAQAAYTGEDTEQAVKEILLPLAEAHGMPFTLEELKAAELAQGTLEESELAAVSGGRTHYGLCLGFGTSFKRSGIAFCFVIGEIEPE